MKSMPTDTVASKLAEMIKESINKDHAETSIRAVEEMCNVLESNPHARPLLDRFIEERYKRMQAK